MKAGGLAGEAGAPAPPGLQPSQATALAKCCQSALLYPYPQRIKQPCPRAALCVGSSLGPFCTHASRGWPAGAVFPVGSGRTDGTPSAAGPAHSCDSTGSSTARCSPPGLGTAHKSWAHGRAWGCRAFSPVPSQECPSARSQGRGHEWWWPPRCRDLECVAGECPCYLICTCGPSTAPTACTAPTVCTVCTAPTVCSTHSVHSVHSTPSISFAASQLRFPLRLLGYFEIKAVLLQPSESQCWN